MDEPTISAVCCDANRSGASITIDLIPRSRHSGTDDTKVALPIGLYSVVAPKALSLAAPTADAKVTAREYCKEVHDANSATLASYYTDRVRELLRAKYAHAPAAIRPSCHGSHVPSYDDVAGTPLRPSPRCPRCARAAANTLRCTCDVAM